MIGSSVDDAGGSPKISNVRLLFVPIALYEKKHMHNTGGKIIITKTKDNPAEAQHGKKFPPSRRQNNARRHATQWESNLYEKIRTVNIFI